MKVFFFLYGILFSTVLLAQPLCINKLTGDVNSFSYEKTYQNENYEFIKTTPGQNGGRFVLLKIKNEKSWMLGKRSFFDNAPGGNPMWFFMILPKEITEYFGFKIFDEKMQPFHSTAGPKPIYLQLPDVFEINRGLEKLDALLISKSIDPIRYRLFVDQGKTSNENYLRKLVNESMIPYSTDQYISFHDLNYHFLTIFLTSKLMYEQSQLTNEIYLKFTDWLKRKYPEIGTREVTEQIFLIRSSEIDRLGNVTVAQQDPYEPSYTRPARSGLSAFLGAGKSPFDVLVEGIDTRKTEVMHLKNLKHSHLEEFKISLEEKFLHPNEKIQELLRDEDAVANLITRAKEIGRVLRAP